MSAAALLLSAAVAAAPTCSLPPGWEAVDAHQPRYVVLGEMHGTAEAPAFTADLICALARRGERILVALEQSADRDTALQAAWRLRGARFRAALPAALAWQGRTDGNGSIAMRDLLVRLHALRRGGARIGVTAFNGERRPGDGRAFAALPGQGPHEALQAANIRAAAAAGRYDRIVVLVGNLHAATAVVSRGGASFEPMAMRLARPDERVSLDLVGGGGTSWNCQMKAGAVAFTAGRISSDAIECGPHPVRAPAQVPGPAPSVALGRFPGSVAPALTHDGYVWLGRSTASPPVLP